jgi:threonine dehydrogenase-like Zn-dependent dehydrogenase
VNQSIRVARHAGRVVVTGIPSESKTLLDFHELRRKELGFFPVRRSNHESDLAVRLLAERSSLFAPLITHVRPIDEIQRAFEILERYEDGIGKLVIRL